MLSEVNYKFYKNNKKVGEITLSKKDDKVKRTNAHVIKMTKRKLPTHFSINGSTILKFDKDKFNFYLLPKRVYNKKIIVDNLYLPFTEPLKIHLKPVKYK